MEVADPQFWLAVLQIIAIDIVLGGDNAVVIALACRRLPERQRNIGIFWGVVGAIGLRVVLIFFALTLLAIPFLKIIAALLLLWIGIKLVQPEPESDGHTVNASTSLFGAIKTVVIADAMMSLDNVVAIAGAARGSMHLVIFGLLVSVPVIVWGSKLVMRLMDRFPITITIGAALLGWIAGEMVLTDAFSKDWMSSQPAFLHWLTPVCGALCVITLGRWQASRKPEKKGPVIDLVDDANEH